MPVEQLGHCEHDVASERAQLSVGPEADEADRNGAEFTKVHVARSAQFLDKYLASVGLSQASEVARQIVHFTGYEVRFDQISTREENVAMTLGASHSQAFWSVVNWDIVADNLARAIGGPAPIFQALEDFGKEIRKWAEKL